MHQPTEPASPDGSVIHVVLTGGGCAGKSTTTHAVADELRARGARVLTVDETPTAMINSGMSDLGEFPPAVRLAVQHEMVRLMRANWISYHRAAAAVAAWERQPVVVIHDQGEMAALAYFGEQDFVGLLDDMGLRTDDILGSYDLVIVCHSAARTGGYETASNTARYESDDVAHQLDLGVEAAWARHSNVATIEWQPSHTDKVALALASVTQLLDDTKTT